MADSRNNRNSYRTVYVNDNLARKQEAYIETTSPRKRETVTQQPEKQDLHKAHTKANHGLSSSFGFAFTLVMAGVMVGIFIIYIYKVATEELGMVYPSCSQIVSYDSEDSEYVVQYKDVE